MALVELILELTVVLELDTVVVAVVVVASVVVVAASLEIQHIINRVRPKITVGVLMMLSEWISD